MAAVGTLSMTTGADAAGAKSRTTDYAFYGFAYGTKANTGMVGASSGATAHSKIGCTRLTGKKDPARITSANIPKTLNVGAVTSNSSTYRKKNGRVGMLSTNKVATVTLGDPRGVHLQIKGLATRADAFASKSGKFGAKATFNAVDIVAKTGTPLDDVLGGSNPLNALLKELQKRGGNLEIPMLGVLKLGERNERVSKSGAKARATALQVKLYGPDTKAGGDDDVSVKIGRASARLIKGVPSGVMSGNAKPVQGSLLNGTVKVGPVANKVLKCQGTKGKVEKDAVVGLNLLKSNLLLAGVAQSRVYGKQLSKDRVKAWTEGSIANVSLGSGKTSIKIKGIVGRANVNRTATGKLKKNIKGSQIAELSIGGQKVAIPRPGQAIEVPGVAKLRFFVTSKTKNSIKVSAVRLTLLDGTVGTVDLGVARTLVRKH